MQSKTLRGARRLLVAAGVITLVCSVVAPAAVSASNAGGIGNGQGVEQGADKVWVCHRTASGEVNPWELIEVSVNAVDVHLDHHEDQWFGTPEQLLDLLTWATTSTEDGGLGVTGLHQSTLQRLEEAQLDALTAFCAAHDADQEVDAELVVEEEDLVEEADIEDEDTGDEGGTGGDEQDDVVDEPPAPRGPKPIQVSDDAVSPPLPPAPLPEPQISADHVVAPVVETPAPAGQPEVLGVTTTRTPTGELASTAGITSLPRTGTDSTTILALVGGLLVATGVGLEALGRRGHLAAVGGRR